MDITMLGLKINATQYMPEEAFPRRFFIGVWGGLDIKLV